MCSVRLGFRPIAAQTGFNTFGISLVFIFMPSHLSVNVIDLIHCGIGQWGIIMPKSVIEVTPFLWQGADNLDASMCQISHIGPRDLFHKWVMSSSLKFHKKSSYSKFYYNDPIRSQFCTCHDSWAVVACAKLWPYWILMFHVRITDSLGRFRLWGHKLWLPD